MCPSGLALRHPAATMLTDWLKFGCPTETSLPWKNSEIEEAIARGPHISALSDNAIAHFAKEIEEKTKLGQARVVLWDDIKDNPPPQLKVSPVAAIPHKSKAFRSILDLSYPIGLSNGTYRAPVNETTTKTTPTAAIEQLGHSLQCIIHAFAQAPEQAKIFMAKWDIKDGFWCLDCQEGEDWNFAYVLPQHKGKPVTLVIPTSLQMGWIESPPYFCAASETSRDVGEQYTNTPIGSLPAHKFEWYSNGDKSVDSLPDTSTENCAYKLEVFVDDFMSLVIATSKEQLRHVARAVMMGIHDVFPPKDDDNTDPISMKKLSAGKGSYSTTKTLLGFNFNGEDKTLWLDDEKRSVLLTILHTWLRAAKCKRPIPFAQFELVISKVRHAFTSIPAGKGLLLPCNKILQAHPRVVALHRNKHLLTALTDIRTLLQESTVSPTRCKEVVSGWPDYIGVKDVSIHGVGGYLVGENMGCIPTVFRCEWPQDIKDNLVSEKNPNGGITNSDLEMAGLVMLFLVMEAICPKLEETHIALFSDNAPTVSWVTRLASRQSVVAGQLLRALTLRQKLRRCCPLTPIHIAGVKNSMADLPSRSFGSVAQWHCTSDEELLPLYNIKFPLPTQESWTVFQLTSEIATRVISVLRMKHFSLEEWRRLPPIGRHKAQWRAWCMYVKPLGVDTYLQAVGYTQRMRILSGFAARVRTGYYGRGGQVRATMVSSYISAVGKTITLVCNENPTKMKGQRDLCPRLQQMLEGWSKADPVTKKQLPVEADVPEWLANVGYAEGATELTQATGDLALIAFYYLLRVGEYTVKTRQNNTKQTVQFKMEDVTFFKVNRKGQLRCLPRDAPDWLIELADGATLKLDNQKNGWKGVCIYQEANGEHFLCPVRALARRILRLRANNANTKSYLSTYYTNGGVQCDVTMEDMSKAIKRAAAELSYPYEKGIPMERINTHSLRCGGANALALSGYTDTQIQKMGRWRGATFKEYIRDELANWLVSMQG